MVWTLNQSLVTTLGACGDVVRNTVACPAPDTGRLRLDLAGQATRLAERFRPTTTAYWEIWVDGERTVTAEAADDDPLYGAAYLPRKFKIGIAAPGDNCVDVHTHDVGLVPVAGADGEAVAVTVLVGGGQGRSHNRPSTYPRLADPFATVAPDEVGDVVAAIVAVQRDHGDRTDRKQARLKYLVDRWGLDGFRAAVEAELGRPLDAAGPVHWSSHRDHLGWQPQGDGGWYLGLPVASGRIADRADHRLRTALRRIAEEIRPDIRFTPQQNVIIGGLDPAARPAVDDLLAAHGVQHSVALTPVVRNAMACVALPTCGLALTDAERSFPEVLASVDTVLDEVGLAGHTVDIRMVGCPNGCARPYSTEIGMVGRRKGAYDLYLGGAADGTRLNTLFAEIVRTPLIAETLRPVLAAYAGDRHDQETFGDWCHRQGVDVLRRRFGHDPVEELTA
jgi:sulfite reductase (ferredoxin)